MFEAPSRDTLHPMLAPHPLAPAFDPTSSDADLMQRIVAQDQSALLALYERFGSQVYGLALHVLRDGRLAEEASQDAFLKVWNKSVQWDPTKGQLGSWLLTIARYATIDRLRREQRHNAAGATFPAALPDHTPVHPSSATADGSTVSCCAN